MEGRFSTTLFETSWSRWLNFLVGRAFNNVVDKLKAIAAFSAKSRDVLIASHSIVKIGSLEAIWVTNHRKRKIRWTTVKIVIINLTE